MRKLLLAFALLGVAFAQAPAEASAAGDSGCYCSSKTGICRSWSWEGDMFSSEAVESCRFGRTQY